MLIYMGINGLAIMSCNQVRQTIDCMGSPKVGSKPCRSVSQGVGRLDCLPKSAWPPTCHIQRETSCSKPRLNSNMDADLYGYKWARDNVGQSGATIYRLYGKPDAPELFLKHGKGSVANDVTDEMVRLNWLTEFMPQVGGQRS